MPTILGANTASAEDLITNSARFDNNANYLYADRFGTPSNADKYTISFWFKIGSRNNVDQLISYNYANGNRGFVITLRNDASIRWEEFTAGSATHSDIKTNRLFRDSSAWYHIVVAYDSTQGTASNRQKLYINGVQETSLATATYSDQNFDGFLGTTPNNNKGFIIGAYYNGQGNIDSANYTDGYMAHFYLIDGTAYAASDFGETDTNGVWVPKDAKDNLTFGTNGFFLEFKQTGTSANASGIGADTSGNDNHFSVSGFSATDITTDTPMNNFSTGNPLIHIADGNITPSFSEGNTKWTSGANSSYGTSGHGNIAVTNGKWYWEMKIDAGRNNGVNCGISPVSVFESKYGTSTSTDYTYAQDNYGSFGYQFTNSGSKKITGTAGGNATDYGSPNWSVDDIIGVAMDLDNDTLTFYLNGTSQGEAFSSLPDVYYTPAWYGYYDTVWEFNAGNPYNAISSGNSDANGHGNFEYAVPSGYFALCTKNLAEYG